MNTDGVHRGERRAWLLLGIITAALVLLGSAIHTYEYLGGRRVAECHEDLEHRVIPAGGDEWARCDESGDWGGN